MDKHGKAILYHYISVDIAHHELFRAKVGKGGIKSVQMWPTIQIDRYLFFVQDLQILALVVKILDNKTSNGIQRFDLMESRKIFWMFEMDTYNFFTPNLFYHIVQGYIATSKFVEFRVNFDAKVWYFIEYN